MEVEEVLQTVRLSKHFDTHGIHYVQTKENVFLLYAVDGVGGPDDYNLNAASLSCCESSCQYMSHLCVRKSRASKMSTVNRCFFYCAHELI